MTCPRPTSGGDAITARSRPTTDKHHNSNLPEGISDDAPGGAQLRNQLCKAPGGRCSHDLPEVTSGKEILS
jgi:hypothetical protein